MTEEFGAEREVFVSHIVQSGKLTSDLWIKAFREVPRHVFLPSFFVQTSDGMWRPVDGRRPEYAGLVYADTTLTTQINGLVEPGSVNGPVIGVGTSSSTQPGLMAAMLEALDVEPATRILEIGTGTGYNAALLAHRLGPLNVTTVEVDRTVAKAAAANLQRCHLVPDVVVGDGQLGWPAYAPYGRLIATCSVPAVPGAWLDQVRDGGIIVTSLWRELGGGPLVRLVVREGTASGRFRSTLGGFMPVRDRSAVNVERALNGALKQHGDRRPAMVASEVIHRSDAGLWISLLVRGASWLGFTPEDGSDQLWLFAADGSWSMLDAATKEVEQFGPRRLWDEVERAFGLWKQNGGPARERLGLTVDRSGKHSFWLDEPSRTLWAED
ncbi:ATP-grasp peptide maturase system methyltransferase [Hamadaea tsunoensis]|uniref:ATP-grasp peptide maturase system methyltransferase n=1 Tax=Hamadaea tsunoensis TaxID=53368 RepID=UPI00040CB50C|nr:ATP-grasp peptide maturase system methyltransferase [Hamadaea tsunoensis]